MDLNKLRESIQDIVTESRYRHVLGVEEVSVDLALIYGYDTLKASIAGILHDCAKHIPDEEMIPECERYNLPISDTEKKQPYLLHAKLGAVYAKEKYGIEDVDILNAITYHTTGRPAMSLLEKILYVADFIEPNRKHIPTLDKARVLAYEDLDEAVICISNSSLNYLMSKGAIIDPLTKETYEYYVNQSKSRKN